MGDIHHGTNKSLLDLKLAIGDRRIKNNMRTGAAHNGSVVRQLPRKMIKIENTQLSSINYWKKTSIEEITLKLPKNKNKNSPFEPF